MILGLFQLILISTEIYFMMILHLKQATWLVVLLQTGLHIINVFGQTAVSIQHPHGDSPNEGQQFYQLMCIVSNFEPSQFHSISWFLNGDIIWWGEQLIPDYARGHMSVELEGRMNNNATLYSYLTILKVILTDTGNYQCSIVEGELNNFLIKASDTKSIIVKGMIPTGYYFPSAPWPICYPRVDINVLLGTEITIGCISQKGNPPVGIELFLRNGQALVPVADIYKDKVFVHETVYSVEISSESNNAQYLCQIQVSGPVLPSMMSTCLTGHIVVGLIEQKIVQVQQGAEAHFSCRKPEGGTIVWSTEPNIPETRMTSVDFSTSSLMTITNLRVEENNTVVHCRTEQPYGLRDEGKIIVLGNINSNENPTAATLTLHDQAVSPRSATSETTPTSNIHTLVSQIFNMPERPGSQYGTINQIFAAGIGAAIVIGFMVIVVTVAIIVLLQRNKTEKSCLCKGYLISFSVSKTQENRVQEQRQPEYETSIIQSATDAAQSNQDVHPERPSQSGYYENSMMPTDIDTTDMTQSEVHLDHCKTGPYTDLNLSDISHFVYEQPHRH